MNLYLVGGLGLALLLAVAFGIHETKALGEAEALRDADRVTYQGNMTRATVANQRWQKSYTALAGEFTKRQAQALARDRQLATNRKARDDEEARSVEAERKPECAAVDDLRFCADDYQLLREPAGLSGADRAGTAGGGLPAAGGPAGRAAGVPPHRPGR